MKRREEKKFSNSFFIFTKFSIALQLYCREKLPQSQTTCWWRPTGPKRQRPSPSRLALTGRGFGLHACSTPSRVAYRWCCWKRFCSWLATIWLAPIRGSFRKLWTFLPRRTPSICRTPATRTPKAACTRSWWLTAAESHPKEPITDLIEVIDSFSKSFWKYTE